MAAWSLALQTTEHLKLPVRKYCDYACYFFYFFFKYLSAQQRNNLHGNSLIPLALSDVIDHLLDWMLISVETGRPPWGCSIKQDDSSRRDRAIKRTLAGKSLWKAHKRRAQAFTHAHTALICTHIVEFTLHNSERRAITISRSWGLKEAIIRGVVILFCSGFTRVTSCWWKQIISLGSEKNNFL